MHTKWRVDNEVGLAFCMKHEEEDEEEHEDEDGKLETAIAPPLPSIIAICIFLESER